MIEVSPYAPSCWSERAQRIFNLATYAHFKACDLEHEPARIINDKVVMFPTPRAAWYSHWSDKLYAALDALPDEDKSAAWLEEG